MMLEREIEKKLVDGVKSVGGLCVKFISPGRSGVNDRICILPRGRTIHVETKRKGEKPRPQQDYWIGQLKKRGHDIRVLAGLNEVLEFIEELKRNAEV